MRENALGTVFGVLNTACLVQSWTGCEITALSPRQGSKIYMFCVLNRVRVSFGRPNPPTQIPVEYTPPPPLPGEHSLRKCDPRLSRYVYVFSVFLNVAVSFRGRCCFQSSYVFFFAEEEKYRMKFSVLLQVSRPTNATCASLVWRPTETSTFAQRRLRRPPAVATASLSLTR